jgi:hypothetical protein
LINSTLTPLACEVVQFLFQQLRASYGELSDDDFKAMVLLALDEGTHIAED